MVFLEYVRTLGVVGWFDYHVVKRGPQAVFHKSGCFLALMVRAVMGIGGMGDLVRFLCHERLAKTLGFEKELTFVNPIADLLKEFTESMVNDLLQETVRTLVSCGVQIGEVVAVDASFLHVFGKKYENAARGYSGNLGKTALGYKLHLAYDVQLRLPIAMTITPGNVSDAKALETLRHRIAQVMGKRPNQTVILDRGYFDAKVLHRVDRDDGLFVCRAKMWPKYITTAVAKLQEKDFRFRTKKYRVAHTLVIEPTTQLLLRLVVVRHASFPKPLVLVTNATDLRPVQVYRLYKKRFTIEAAFHELRQRWNLNRFVGNRYSQVVGHVGIVVSGATRLNAVLMQLLEASIPKPRILIDECAQP